MTARRSLQYPMCGVSVLVTMGASSKVRCRSVLLGKRKGSHGAGQWSTPGGRIEPLESPRACAARELQEETGLVADPGEFLRWERCSVNNTLSGGQPWVTLFYELRWDIGLPFPQVVEPDKCEGWEFFPVNDLPSPLFKAAEDCFRRTGWLND